MMSTSDPDLAALASELQKYHFKQIFEEWRQLAYTLRKNEYHEGDDENIDIHDVKCKMWGLLLRNMFGLTLGSGDYVHLTIEHSSMLFRVHGSFRKYSNQGFEASHKQHRMLYSRSTNHDRIGEAESLKQILTHWYSEKLLSIRYQFVKAKECIIAGKSKFYYRGCGWKNQFNSWSKDEIMWIFAIVHLFEKIFGQDFLKYVYNGDTGTKISSESDPRETFEYSHTNWEEQFPQIVQGIGSETSAFKLRKLKSQPHSLGMDLPSSCVLDGITPISSDDTDDDNMPPPGSPSSSGEQSNAGTFDIIDEVGKEESESRPYEKPNVQNCEIVNEDGMVKSKNNPKRSSCQEIHFNIQQFSLVTFDTIPVDQELLKSAHVTRGRLASVILPSLNCNVTSSDVHLLFNSNIQLTNPYDLKERPSEAVLRTVNRKIKGSRPSGITIGCLGTFNTEGIEVLQKFCKLSKLRKDVKAEIDWLFQDSCFSKEDKLLIGNFLWNKNQSEVICKHHHKIIDVEAFQAFSLERYLDNMSIDVCISHYLAQSKSKVSTLHVPFEAWTWINALSDNDLCDNLKEILQDTDCHALEQVTMVVHFQTKMHWGLIVAQIDQHLLYFDDGLNSSPPCFAVRGICKVLNVLQRFISNKHKLFWDDKNTVVLPFGMDNQGNASRISGNGSGSCGVGVILAAKDFITYGSNAVNNMSWQFKDTPLLRKQLMLDVISWR